MNHFKDASRAVNGEGYTFMSDRQKGVIKALDAIVPRTSSLFLETLMVQLQSKMKW